MGSSGSNLDPNTSAEGTKIGHTGLLNLYQKDVSVPKQTAAQIKALISGSVAPVAVTTVVPATTKVVVLSNLTKPMANPCSTNVTNSLLTKANVQAEYPAFKWGSSEPWTAQEMQCWAWLATQSKELHPSRAFAKQYGFEPYLMI